MDADGRNAITPFRGLASSPRVWLFVYAVVLAAIAFWPVPVDSGSGPLLMRITRLLPLLTYDRIEFTANIFLFVPFGALLTLLITRDRWLIVPIVFLTTVTIEWTQDALLPARTASVFDVVANVAGACAGILLVAGYERMRERRQAR